MPAELPNELLLEVAEHLCDDRNSLRALSRVSRLFTLTCRQFLFAEIDFNRYFIPELAAQHLLKYQSLLTILKANPDLASCTRTLRVQLSLFVKYRMCDAQPFVDVLRFFTRVETFHIYGHESWLRMSWHNLRPDFVNTYGGKIVAAIEGLFQRAPVRALALHSVRDFPFVLLPTASGIEDVVLDRASLLSPESLHDGHLCRPRKLRVMGESEFSFQHGFRQEEGWDVSKVDTLEIGLHKYLFEDTIQMFNNLTPRLPCLVRLDWVLRDLHLDPLGTLFQGLKIPASTTSISFDVNNPLAWVSSHPPGLASILNGISQPHQIKHVYLRVPLRWFHVPHPSGSWPLGVGDVPILQPEVLDVFLGLWKPSFPDATAHMTYY